MQVKGILIMNTGGLACEFALAGASTHSLGLNGKPSTAIRPLAVPPHVATSTAKCQSGFVPHLKHCMTGGVQMNQLRALSHVPGSRLIAMQAHPDDEFQPSKGADDTTDVGVQSESAATDELKEGEGRLPFGLSQLGSRVGTIIQRTTQRTSDGNEMNVGLSDRLKDCYPACPIESMKYTMNNDDFSGRRLLRIDKVFADEDDSFYHKLMRDTVFAEWVDDPSGKPELQIKMHLTDNSEGPGPSWEAWLKNSRLPEHVTKEIVHIGGEMRKRVFQAHSEDAIEVIFSSIKNLLEEHPQLVDSPVSIHYLSDLESLQETVSSETVGHWLNKMEGLEAEGEAKLPIEVLNKNLEIWKDAFDSAQNAFESFMQMLVSQCKHGSGRQVLDELAHPGVPELIVLMIMIASDSIQKH